MQSEIDVIIKEKLDKKGCEKNEIGKVIKAWQDEDIDNIPKELLKLQLQFPLIWDGARGQLENCTIVYLGMRS